LSVLVKIGGQNATIYSDDGVTAQANPMTSDSNGGPVTAYKEALCS